MKFQDFTDYVTMNELEGTLEKEWKAKEERVMETYLGTKIIQAEPMEAHVYVMRMNREPGLIPEIDSSGHSQSGYHVLYPDNYHSWSPKAVFEEAYRKVSVGEMRLLGDLGEKIR